MSRSSRTATAGFQRQPRGASGWRRQAIASASAASANSSASVAASTTIEAPLASAQALTTEAIANATLFATT